MRGVWLRVHRYAGLLLAGFLLMAGLTGSLLAWNAELDEALNPQLFDAPPPAASSAMLAPLVLRDIVLRQYPQALVTRVPLSLTPGMAASFLLRAKPGTPILANDQVFVHPYTGQILGHRRWGDITQGWHNLVPFVYRLHYSLALGPVGTLVMGIVALIWMLDCFVGLYLTFPVRTSRRPSPAHPLKPWASRWGKAWKISLRSPNRMVFDLHRAGGLWLWLALLGLAISSVALNLPQAYDPALGVFAERQVGPQAPAAREKPLWAPRLDWQEGYQLAQRYMRQEGVRRGFTIESESSMSYDARRGLYRYDVRSSLDIKDTGGSTRIFLDGETGGLAATWLPTGGAAGDTITTWLTNLHMAAVGRAAGKLAISVLGIAVSGLCITGVLLWWRKRRARTYIKGHMLAPTE